MADKKAAIEVLRNRLEHFEIETVPLESIYPNAYNPNRQSDRDFELLKRSIMEDGFTQPVLVQKETREIVDGEHRWRAMKDLAEAGKVEPTIDAIFVDQTAEQMRLSTLRHNRARGSEDYELSAALLRDLRELGALQFAQDALFMESSEIARMLDDSSVAEALAGDAFSEAWTPRPDDRVSDEEATEMQVQDGPLTVASTPAANESLLKAQALLADTTLSFDQKASIVRQRDVWPLELVLTAADGAIVKEVLGDKPAVRLLELCMERDTAAPAPAEDQVAIETADEPDAAPVAS